MIWGTTRTQRLNEGLVYRRRIHQSCIKCLAVAHLPSDLVAGERSVVFSGGDDNAIALTVVSTKIMTGDLGPRITLSTLLIPRAHATAVTTIVVLSKTSDIKEGSTSITFMTSGNDQRIKVWDVTIRASESEAGQMRVRRIANKPTPIADVSSITRLSAVSGDGTTSVSVAICGVGIDIRRISLQHN